MPDMHVRVGGAWKKVNKAYTRVGGAWKQVINGYVRVGGSWKQFLSSFTPNLGSAIFQFNIANMTLQFNTDGTVSHNFGGTPAPGNWGTPTTSGIGSGYQLRLEKTDGQDPDSGPSLNSFHNLGTVREWAFSGSPIIFTGTLTLQTSGGVTVSTQAVDVSSI
jgi:hypothetical protein